MVYFRLNFFLKYKLRYLNNEKSYELNIQNESRVLYGNHMIEKHMICINMVQCDFILLRLLHLSHVLLLLINCNIKLNRTV